MSNKLDTPDLKKYLFLAFALRMFGSVAYSMLIQYYYGYGDSFTFYDGGNFFTDEISRNASHFSYLFSSFKETSDWYNATAVENTGYFLTPSNNMVMRISALVSYLCFNKFIIIGLFFGFFSFLGQWKLFLVFDDINKHKHRKLLAYAVLCAPSIWFWASGLLKDSICLGSLGFIIHILYKFFVKKKFSFSDLIALVFLIYLVSVIKSYIIIIVLVGFIVMFISSSLKSIKNRLLRIAVLLLILITTGIALYITDFSDQLNNIAEDSITQIRDFQESYKTLQESDENSKAGFEFGEIDPSLNSLILRSPAVVFTCLFRPFLWESKKLIIFLASLETTLVLLATLFVMIRLKFLHFFGLILNSPYLLFCFTISILFALIIGFTTFNFGTMVRYKATFLPFYYFLLINLYSVSTSPAKQPIEHP